MKIAIKVPGSTPQRYVTLDPNDNSIHTDRTVIGPWETFDTSDARFFDVLDAQVLDNPTNPAPSPLFVVPSPDPFSQPIGDYSNREFLKDVIQYGIRVAGLREATGADYAYWEAHWPEMEARGREIGVPDYAWRRLIGWQAGGADKALAGPFA